jgi:hypothetical protein
LEKPLRDEGIKARDDDGKPLSSRIQAAFGKRDGGLGNAFDFYFFRRVLSLSLRVQA